MLKERKIDGWFHVEGRIAGARMRLPLRTRSRENARNTIGEIERALAQGGSSVLWPKLRAVVPNKTFERLAATVGYVEQAPAPAASLSELLRLFEADCLRRIALGKLRASTFERYQFDLREFEEFAR